MKKYQKSRTNQWGSKLRWNNENYKQLQQYHLEKEQESLTQNWVFLCIITKVGTLPYLRRGFLKLSQS